MYIDIWDTKELHIKIEEVIKVLEQLNVSVGLKNKTKKNDLGMKQIGNFIRLFQRSTERTKGH